VKNIGGAFKSGVWIKRLTTHLNSDENGYLTKGKSYQVMSADKHYSQSKNFLNRVGRLIKDVDSKLSIDCVILRDDKGKMGVFGAKNFKQTSKGK
jgi:hypothetical protein